MNAHTEVEGPNWDTKVHCSCGHETVSRAEMWKHQADALRSVVPLIQQQIRKLESKAESDSSHAAIGMRNRCHHQIEALEWVLHQLRELT